MAELMHDAPLVLVADDDPAQCLLMQSVVEQLGLRTSVASNGLEAVTCFKKCKPDLILLDIKMPLLDGLQASEQIRLDKQGKDVPIVLITGIDDHESITRAFDLGVTDFMTKPVIWPILSHRIRYLLKANTAFMELKSSERRLRKTQELAAIGHWEWDLANEKIQLSEQMYSLLNLSKLDFDGSVDAFFGLLPEEDQQHLRAAIDAAVKDKGAWSLDHLIKLPDGIERVVHQQGEISYSDQGEPATMQGLMQDITRRKLAEDEIRHLAYYDSLTGLPNRLNFIENAENCIQQALCDANKLALIFLDIDDFKRINDSLGHHAGDSLLQKVSHRLVENLRDTDSITKIPKGKFVDHGSHHRACSARRCSACL
jgi:PleD family two-component response regulator